MRCFDIEVVCDRHSWMVRIPEIDGLTQARRRDEAELMARECIACAPEFRSRMWPCRFSTGSLLSLTLDLLWLWWLPWPVQRFLLGPVEPQNQAKTDLRYLDGSSRAMQQRHGAAQTGLAVRPPVMYHHDSCGHDSNAEVVCAACGEPLLAADTSMRIGPGYPAKLKRRPDVRRRFGLDNERTG